MPQTRGRGLYELLISERLEDELRGFDDDVEATRIDLRPAEAADRIALHLASAIEHAVSALEESTRPTAGVAIARKVLELLATEVDDPDLLAERPVLNGSILRAVQGRLPDGRFESLAEPLVPLLDTTLLTNAPGEPRVGSQLLAEIASADRIDVLMAFIRRSGITPLIDALQTHCRAGRTLRILTTTYTGSTEARALDELRRAGADVRVSYDVGTTRLHAKAWLFHRRSGFSTAYIGSSNLTHSAQVTGLEWNVRVAGARNPTVVDKVAAVFESYWNSGDFIPYVASEFAERTATVAASSTSLLLSPIDVRPEPFQERLLEKIELARQQGHHRNLLVSATGTGKTVMAALDYARLRDRLPTARLLFVAHREEILEQSLATFRQLLRDHSFGELWVGGTRPTKFQHVFASIQSLSATTLEHMASDAFDVVIVDEFHHAAARTYRRLLERLAPTELLGLTATPERADGSSILDWFDGRIAAELRLWDAIDQHRLVPFAYYGIHDGIDLRAITWRRGTGYDVEGLTNLLTADDRWAKLVVQQVARHVVDLTTMRALGFCVSVAHAQFMSRVFSEAGIAAVAIWADTPDIERDRALSDLRDARVNVVFSVDLFNEGVDVPAVDMLLMLRPTESPTLFLQQLGRGLRRNRNKSICTVLDFVGHHRAEFRFDTKFRALLGGTRRDVEHQIESGFPFLPAGCHVELDRVASEIVLRSIREAVPSSWPAKVAELRSLRSAGKPHGLANYLAATGLELEDVYSGGRSWSDLCNEAGVETAPRAEYETELRRACGRLLHVDDTVRIETWRRFLTSDDPPARMNQRDERLLRMLVAAVADKVVAKNASLDQGARTLWSHRQVRNELVELLEVLARRIDHVAVPLVEAPEVPLQIHSRYSRIEILAAYGIGGGAAKVAPWQTGLRWVEEARTDLLAFTLDKTSGQFSPTTRYRDYAISRELMHWQTQSGTRANSNIGLRFQRHEREGSKVMLFARQRADDRAFYFLGPASYVSHESEMPMSVTWRLKVPLPGDLFAAFAAAVA